MSRDRSVFPLLLLLLIPLASFGSAGSARTAPGNPSIELVTICHNIGPIGLGLQFPIQVADDAVPFHVLQHGDTQSNPDGSCPFTGDPT